MKRKLAIALLLAALTAGAVAPAALEADSPPQLQTVSAQSLTPAQQAIIDQLEAAVIALAAKLPPAWGQALLNTWFNVTKPRLIALFEARNAGR